MPKIPGVSRVAGRRPLLAVLLALAILVTAGVLVRRSPPATEDHHQPGVRRATVDLPDGTPHPQIQFVSRDVGYAMFYRCPGGGEHCPAAIFRTGDGGAGWQRIAHPTRGYVQLYAAPGVLLLWWTDRDVWLLSTDRGRAFTEVPAEEAPYYLYQGFFLVDGSTRVRSWRDGAIVPVPERSPLPAVQTVATGADGRLWVACVDNGVPRVALSGDSGASWAETPVAVQPGEPAATVTVQTSADGRDVWLVGEPADRATFPLLWQFVAGSWAPVSALGHPPAVAWWAPLGGAALGLVGPHGQGVVLQGRYVPLPGWPPADDRMTVLRDGTLFWQDGNTGNAWLGEGVGVYRRWTRVALEPA